SAYCWAQPSVGLYIALALPRTIRAKVRELSLWSSPAAQIRPSWRCRLINRLISQWRKPLFHWSAPWHGSAPSCKRLNQSGLMLLRSYPARCIRCRGPPLAYPIARISWSPRCVLPMFAVAGAKFSSSVWWSWVEWSNTSILKRKSPPIWVIKPSGLTSLLIYPRIRSEEHTSELQSRFDLVCRLLLEKKKEKIQIVLLMTSSIQSTRK